ncbi:MAG: hypothetical protein PUC12_12280 [Clostridiales bacterium]|nr:hypothetical protein [Clostridiales bacterium]
MKLFRDFYPSLLLVIGFSLTLCISLSEMVLMDAWVEENTVYKESVYKNQSKLIVYKEYDQAEIDAVMGADKQDEQKALGKKYAIMAERLLEHLMGYNGNVVLENIWLPLGDGGVMEPVNIVFSYHEPLSRELKSGACPEELHRNEPVALVGDSFSGYSQKTGSQSYIWVAQEHMKVMGEFKNYHTMSEDTGVYLFWDCLGGTSKKEILKKVKHDVENGEELRFVFGSNKASVVKDVGQFYSYCMEEGFVVQDAAEPAEPALDTGSFMKTRTVMNLLTLAVSLVNCVYISMLWIKRRMRELMVCKAFGMETVSIWARVLKDAVKLILLSLLLSMVGMGIYFKLTNQWSLLIGRIDLNLIFLICALVISILAAMIPAFLILLKMEPAKGLRQL